MTAQSRLMESAAPERLAPPLKWAGGKRWLIPYLQPLWARHTERRLVEPFCGGLAVSLALCPAQALLSDHNEHVVNFYQWLQRGLTVTIEMRNDATLYYAHRARFNALIRAGQAQSERAAQLFYYLNRTGYNGLCRFNRRNEFNVPFGRHVTIHYQTDFTRYQPLLNRWQFGSGDFETLRLETDDLVYADPPYDVEFVDYSSRGFAWTDQVRLAYWLAQHPGPVIASNQATDRISSLYQDLGFTLKFLESPRRISCNGDRTPAREILALKGDVAFA
ncbi:MAG: DNA adenine methylase [Aggregatilineales bacterium]